MELRARARNTRPSYSRLKQAQSSRKTIRAAHEDVSLFFRSRLLLDIDRQGYLSPKATSMIPDHFNDMPSEEDLVAAKPIPDVSPLSYQAPEGT